MLLIEVILIAVFLASIAIGTSYFFAQTKVTMRSSSQVMGCQTIAKQALESVVSLGTRLYGYRIHDQSGKLSYEPLFIKDSGGSVVDVGSGSELSFPPKMYKTLYENLGVSPPTQGPKTNTGVPLIGATYPFEISTSTLIVNSVNALQYLYNSESGFFTVKGKMYTNSGGQISSVLKKHKDQFDLKDIKFYIRIAPINLQTEKEVTSPPSKILTRPRFHNPQKVKLSPALKVLGDPDIGFEIKVTLEYTRSDQEYTCDAMHRFTHQIKPIMSKPSKEIHAAMTSLTSEAGEDFLTTPGLLLTSCDTDGVGYDDIAVTVNFNGIEPSQQIGTVILCQMNSYCRSLGNDSYNDCSPELGEWQRCHDIKPTGSDQSWTYTSELEKPQVLKMKFGGMKIDRRYELYVGEFSMAGRKIREKRVSRFYIDAIRPGVNPSITNDAVGAPDDGTGDRNYNGPFTDWKVPDNASSGKWIQCNQQAVTFEGNITDQFTHNLEDCELEGKREDGSGSTTTSPTKKPPCSGELNGIQQGRQTITFIPSDTCGKSPNPGELVWDTDLPSSFEAKDFADPIWLYSGNPYPIKTIVPSKDLAGNFPKHYSVDCTDNFLGTRTREDGDSGQLSCKLGPSNPDHDDGCNPAVMIAQYHHVCGGVGSSVCKNTTWGVYVPLGESCVNVWCEPSLGCCDLSRGTCDGVPHKQCGDPKTRECTDPVGGTQGPEHEVPSDCPPLGLNHCSYYLPCEPTAPYGNLPQPTPPRTFCDGSVSHAPSGCGGLREGDECGIILIPYDCGSGSGPGWQWQDSPPPIEKGLCYNSIDSSESPMIPSNTGGCNCTSVVVRRCKPPGVIQYIVSDSICSGGVSGTCTSGSCSAGGTCSGGDGSPCEEEGTCSASQPGTWSNPPSADGTCSLNGSSCAADVEEVCTTNWEYKLSATGECPPVPIPSGICGEASGGCSRRAGGGNLGSEQCDPRSSACLPPGVVPHPCNSSAECCVGDTYASNPAHCPSDCVKKQGKACCLVSEGGDCSGQFCAANCANSAGCHVREVNNDGVCRPSCGGLAKAQGFAGDGTSDTSTWTHSATSCSDLNTQQLWGSTNWMKIPLIDNKEPSESVTIGGECCARSPSLCDSDKECCDTDTYQTNPDHCSLDGRCGGVSGDLCNTGNAEPSNPNRMTDTWICKGENEGKDSGTCCDTSKNTTCVPAPLENGTCGTGSNLCTVGDPKPSSPNRTTETWICEGKDGGEDSGTCCDSSNPFCSSQNGVCGSPCTVGDREDIDGTKWKCKGVGGGTNSGVCLIDGMCSDTGCSSGTKQPTNPLPNESWICKSHRWRK